MPRAFVVLLVVAEPGSLAGEGLNSTVVLRRNRLSSAVHKIGFDLVLDPGSDGGRPFDRRATEGEHVR